MTAVGIHAHPTRKLGRRAPSNRPALRLGPLLTGTVPTHPASADHFARVSDWGLYRNDAYGDCGPTSVANSRKLITRYLTTAEQSPTQDDVFDLYRRSGNPGFDPATDADDNGVDMQTMLEAVHAGGIGGIRCVAFAKVDPKDLDEVRAAVSIFGFVLLGVDLEVAQQTQTGAGLWDYGRSSEWGGHAVLAGRYATGLSDRLGVVTWGEVVDTTDAFLGHQLEEAWVVIWPEHLGTQAFQQGVDQGALARDYQALTGREFPVQPAPAPQPPAPVPVVPPSPAPVVDAADAALVAALGPWASQRHVGANHAAAVAFERWKRAKGL